MAIGVRRITAEEWPLLRELRLAGLLDAPQAFGQRHETAAAEPETEWQAAARASAQGNRRIWFIARDEAAMALGLVQARRRPEHDCLLFSMWVAPAARRAGVGRLLVDAVDEWAVGWGGRRIVLWVFGTNEGALRFYQRLGFHVLDDGPDTESGIAFGALAMERTIGAPEMS